MESGEPPFDFEERTFLFAKRVRSLVKSLPRTIANVEDAKQLVRASGSVAANYIEANDGLSKKDFLLRLKISRREAKESRLFLRLLHTGNDSPESERQALCAEATELVKILSTMIRRSE